MAVTPTPPTTYTGIETAFVTQFCTNVAMLLQQQDSRLRGACTSYALHGESAEVLEQFGEVTAFTGLGRHDDTPIDDVPEDRRWCYPTDVEWATLEDQQDKLRLIIDPEGPYTRAGVAALSRGIDDIIAAAIFGSAKTGHTGATAVAFPAGQIVANTVGASTGAVGLNVAKLREARRILRKAEVEFDTEEVYVALPADKENDLLAEAQVINLDFTDRPVLTDGRLSGFLGMRFIHSERFPGGAKGAAVDAGEIQIPVWVKSGMGLGVWNDINASVDKRPDKRNAWQVYLKMTVGATRLEEKRVVQILAA